MTKTKAMAKSTRPARMLATGITSRGKYTFVISRSLPTTLLLDSVIEYANNCHASNAE